MGHLREAVGRQEPADRLPLLALRVASDRGLDHPEASGRSRERMHHPEERRAAVDLDHPSEALDPDRPSEALDRDQNRQVALDRDQNRQVALDRDRDRYRYRDWHEALDRAHAL